MADAAGDLGPVLGRVRFDISGTLTYRHTSAAAGWAGACLTHVRVGREGRFQGCWSTLRVSGGVASPMSPFPACGGVAAPPGARLQVAVPGQPCSGSWSAPSESVNLFVDVALVERAFEAPYRESLVLEASRSLHADAFAEHLLQALLADVVAGSPDGPVPGETLVLLLLHRIRAYRPRGPASGARLSAAETRRLRGYVVGNLESTLHLEDLAGCLGMSARHLCRTLRNTLGLTPHRYVMQLRLEHARHLLASGTRSLEEVAERSGFADRSHMSTSFRRVLGTTPNHFRNSLAESDGA